MSRPGSRNRASSANKPEFRRIGEIHPTKPGGTNGRRLAIIREAQSAIDLQVIVFSRFNESFSRKIWRLRAPNCPARSIICAPWVDHLAVGPGLPPGASGGSAPRPDASGQHLLLTEFFGSSFLIHANNNERIRSRVVHAHARDDHANSITDEVKRTSVLM